MGDNKYQLCPCGSGKKLKFCCYETQRTLDQLSDEELFRRAAEFPIYESRVNLNWQEAGIAEVLIVRQTPRLKYYNLAGVNRSLLRIQPAVTSLRKVIELDGARGEVGKRAKADLEALASSIRESSGLTLDRYFENAERFDQAFHCLMDGRFEPAVYGFKLILESEPNHVQSHGNLGVAYAGLGDRVAAVRHLDKAIELDPEYEPAIDNRRIILALPPGEGLNCGQIREVDFYVDRERARRTSCPAAIRFANRGEDMNSMSQASPASGSKST